MAGIFICRAFAASLSRPVSLRTLQIPYPVTVPVRHAAHRAPLPGSGHRRDRDIPYRVVHLVDEKGEFGPPTPLSQIMASIDSQTHFVELVSDNPEKPVVKIKGKKETFQKQKEWNKKQKAVASSNVQKEIQMTWNADTFDVGHKLKKARKELDRGNKVELVFAPKPNQKAPAPAVMEARIQYVWTKMSDVAREWLPRKTEGGVVVLYLRQLEDGKKSTPES